MKINQKNAILILNKCLESGVDFAEIFFEETINSGIFFENKSVENIKNNIYHGIGIRLIKKDKSIYGYTNEINKKKIFSLIDKLNIFFQFQNNENNKKKKVLQLQHKKIKKISPIKKSFFKTPIEPKIKILEKACATMQNYSPIIKNTFAVLSSTNKKIKIFNSNGLYAKDNSERTEIILKVIGNINDKYETVYKKIGKQHDIDFFLKLDIKKIATETAKEVIDIINAKNCPAGKMTVVIGSDNGVLFHEACGHPLEASFISKNLSVFSNKIGEQIASPLITLYDDGTIPNAWGSNNIDDEGNNTQKNCLIKKGILVNYLIDNFNGAKINKKVMVLVEGKIIRMNQLVVCQIHLLKTEHLVKKKLLVKLNLDCMLKN